MEGPLVAKRMASRMEIEIKTIAMLRRNRMNSGLRFGISIGAMYFICRLALISHPQVLCECRKDVMPTYQYTCDACQEFLEVIQSFTDDALTTCPSCEAPQLRKVYGSVGVVFKGSGFYKTDSRSATNSGSSQSTASSNSSSTTSA